MNEYIRGWIAADEAIRFKLQGYRDYSQGNTEWDDGWNDRIAYEENQNNLLN